MKTYDSLQQYERDAIERAMDHLGIELLREREYAAQAGVALAPEYKPANDDRAARAAEALAVYLKESQA